MEKEKHFQCPYCGSDISMVFDTISGNQKYIEDCEVCCKPIEVILEDDRAHNTEFFAETRTFLACMI
jgi:transcription elongation factor Elf1